MLIGNLAGGVQFLDHPDRIANYDWWAPSRVIAGTANEFPFFSFLLADRQEEARRRFAESGFPTLRDEAWRFTDVSPIAKTRFTAAPEGKLTPGAIAPYAFGNDEGIRLTFVNGRPSLPLSRSQGRPKGMVVLPLSEALKHPAHAAAGRSRRRGDTSAHTSSAAPPNATAGG